MPKSSEKEKQNNEVGYVKPREITSEMQESYLDYAMSVIVSRALPDVRDGLKPVHRRILFAMYSMGLTHSAKFRKSATVVGETLGKYHPHGDMAVYNSMVRMAQDFSLRYPLVKGQGNFGSIDGDNPASMRYTEAKLSAIGETMLDDIGKDTVDFRPNYDGTRQEPIVLPSPTPQLLLNGSLGIAVGMATNIPPHNAREVLDSCIYLIDHPQAVSEDLMRFVQGPDFPTGGIIYGKKDIIAAYSQGKGSILIRGKTTVEETEKGAGRIIITEIPYQVQKNELVKQFARMVEDKRIDGVRDIRDESDREGMRIVIELKKEAFPKKILNSLFKFSDLQKTFHLNMLALLDGVQPRVFSLADALTAYLKHRKEIILRRTKFELLKAKARAHILDGLLIALKNIDEVIKIIKKSENKESAQKNLRKKFKLTEIQANAILEMRLQSLAKLEQEKIAEELKDLEKIIKEFNLILKNQAKVKDIQKKELKEMYERYGDDRRTKVFATKPGEIGDEDLVPKEDVIITLTQGGYIKRVKPSSYKIQKRGGSGIMGLEVSNEDMVEHFLGASTLDKLLFFSDSGKVFQIFVWEIPEMSRTSKGRGLLNFLEIARDEKVLNMVHYGNDDAAGDKKYLVMVTKNGIIKKTELSSFENVRRSGLIAINLRKGDALKKADIVSKGDEVILTSKKGKSIRFKEGNLRPMGRAAAGVKGIRLGAGPAYANATAGKDEVVGMDIIKCQMSNVKCQRYLLVITENGSGKRTKIEQYRLQGRGGSGIKTARLTAKTGEIVFSKVLGEEEKDLIIISEKGQVIRSSLSSIPVIGRVSSGVRVMRLKTGDKVVSAICL